MKIGDLVRSVDPEDDDVGVVVSVNADHVVSVITQYEDDVPSVRVNVFWGPDPSFGSQFEWDWADDLKVVEESGD